MGFLLLSGGGNAEQTRSLNRFFADQAKGHLLYIPIAGDPKVRSYNHSFEYIKSVFYPLGITNMTMWTDLAGKTNLTPYSAIYFSGGNTLRLLKTESFTVKVPGQLFLDNTSLILIRRAWGFLGSIRLNVIIKMSKILYYWIL